MQYFSKAQATLREVMCLFVVIASIVATSTPVSATDIFLAPRADNAVGAGSYDDPFSSFYAAVGAIKEGGGDRIVLKKGRYGRLALRKVVFEEPVLIIPEVAGQVHFEKLILHDCEGLHFRGLSVWPSPQAGAAGVLVMAQRSSRIVFESFDVRGREDAPDTYMSWSREDWTSNWRSNGFTVSGSDISVLNSDITGVAFGITAYADRALVVGNRIRGFSGDGMRGLGSGSRFEDNLVQDSFEVDNNHDDGFQSWSPKKNGPDSTIHDVTIAGNTILEWTGPSDHPYRGTLQGIGLFDGFYENFSIRNNLIVVSIYHGISMYGGVNSEILNNTVVHPSGGRNKHPWIMVTDHKNGKPSRSVIVANNVAMNYKHIPNALRLNAVAVSTAQMFTDFFGGDYSPRPNGPLVDRAHPQYAPSRDIRGLQRPQGAGPDLGAFEVPR